MQIIHILENNVQRTELWLQEKAVVDMVNDPDV